MIWAIGTKGFEGGFYWSGELAQNLLLLWRNKWMLILSLIGFLVIMEALNQAYEGGDEDGDV